jgi:tether containing UBX domain for GLUT4
MVKIGEYFKASGDDTPAPTPNQPSLPSVTEGQNEDITESSHPETSNQSAAPASAGQGGSLPDAPPVQPTSTSASGRSITVFSPPSADTPSSAQIPYNEEDYIPSVEHAKAHQRQLNQSSRNQRLLTDAELAAKATAEEKRRSEIHEVNVKVRFPDQSQVVSKFGPADTGKSLYGFVRSCLGPAYKGEKFGLNVFVNATLGRPGHSKAIPESDQRLIKDLGLAGRVLVNFTWADATSEIAQQRRTDLLRPELLDQAREMKVEQPPEIAEEPAAEASSSMAVDSSGSGGTTKSSGLRKNGGVPKWLKLPGKK